MYVWGFNSIATKQKDTLEREDLRCDAISWRGASKFLRIKTHIFFGSSNQKIDQKAQKFFFCHDTNAKF